MVLSFRLTLDEGKIKKFNVSSEPFYFSSHTNIFPLRNNLHLFLQNNLSVTRILVLK